MIDTTLCAFLYSNKNYELSSSLSSFCNSQNINLLYMTELKELFIKDEDFDNTILFIDCFTCRVSKDLIEFITVKHTRNVLKVIYICDDTCYEEDCIDNQNVFRVDFRQDFYDQLNRLISKFRKEDFCVKRKCDKDLSKMVYDFLIELQVSPKYVGFRYLKDAILYCLAENSKVGNFARDLYVYLSQKHNTTVHNIERNIRMVIDKSWALCDDKNLLFRNKPTNKEFIAVLVNSIYNQIG